MEEHFFQCPYCWQEISMLLDPTADSNYIEDCEVCCNPIQINASYEEHQLLSFSAENIEQ